MATVNARLSAAKPARFASCVSNSVSNDCNRKVNAISLGRILGKPSGVFDIFHTRPPHKVAQRQLDILLRRESLKCRSMRSL
jgi:hypothetical protein